MKKTIQSLLPLLLGIALACGMLILLQPRATRAAIVTLVQTTLEDFNRGSFYRTGMTRVGDGEVTLLSSGIAGEWITTTNSTGLVPRFGHASLIYNNRLYVFGGVSANGSLRSIQYATIYTSTHNLSNWTTSSVALPTSIYTSTVLGAGVSGLAAVQLNGYVYLLGGVDTNLVGFHYNVVAFSKINPTTGELGPLNTTTPLPQARSYGQAVVLNNRIYYIAGTSNGVTTGFSTVYYATPDPTTGVIAAWNTTTAPLPYAPYGETAVANKDSNRIYVMSGFYFLGGGVVPNVYYASPLANTGDIAAWTNTTPLPRNLYGSAAALFGGQIYDTGGAIDDVTSASDRAFAAFDELSGGIITWTATSVITPARLLHTAAVNYDGWIYLVGGSSDGLAPITQHLVNAGSTTGQGGSAYASSGTYQSPDFDIVKNYQMQALAWTTYLSDPSAVTLTVRYRYRQTFGGYSPWSDPYPSVPVAGVAKTTIPLSITARYLQYQAYFATTNPLTTPILSEVDLTYNRPDPPAFVKAALPASGSNIQVGQRITYTMRFTNTTGTTLLNVTISDTVPANTTYVPGSITASPGITSHAEFQPGLFWEIGSLVPNASGQVGFVATVNSGLQEGDEIRNAARLDSDTVYADAFAFHTFGTPPQLFKSHVSSAPLAANGRVQPGDLIIYTLTYNNPQASAPLSGAVISDALPAQVTFVSGSPLPDLSLLASDRIIRWPIGSVPSGGIGSVSFTVSVNDPAQVPDGANIVNSASLGSIGRNTVNSNSDSIPVRYRFDLQLSKKANVTKALPGSNLTYTIRITNVAQLPITANGIEVLDYLQPGLPGLTQTNVINCVAPCAGWNFVEIDPQGEQVYSRIIPQLGPNQSTVVTMVVHIADNLATTAPDVLAVSNVAEANADDSAGIEIRPTNQRDQAITTVAGPDIEVINMTAPARTIPGRRLTVTARLHNDGFSATRGPDGTGWFGVDVYARPVPTDSLRPSGPGDRYLGFCATTDNPCASSDQRGDHYTVAKFYTTVIGAGGLAPDEAWNITYSFPITVPGTYWLYVQADTFWGAGGDPSPIYGSSSQGRVREGNGVNNIYGPLPVIVAYNAIYLPIMRR